MEMMDKIREIHCSTKLSSNTQIVYVGDGFCSVIDVLKTSCSMSDIFIVLQDHQVPTGYMTHLRKLQEQGRIGSIISLEYAELNGDIGIEKISSILSNSLSENPVVIGVGDSSFNSAIKMSLPLQQRRASFVEVPVNYQSVLSTIPRLLFAKRSDVIDTIAVFIDSSLIAESSSIEDIQAGLVSGIKNAMIYDLEKLDFFTCFEDELEDLEIDLHRELLEALIESQAQIVSDCSKGLCCWENYRYGSFFSAVAANSIPHAISGVRAEAIGMCIAAQISSLLGYLKDDEVDMHYFFLADKLQLDLDMNSTVAIDDLVDALMEGSQTLFLTGECVILEKIGKCASNGEFIPEVSREILEKAIRNHQQAIAEFTGEQWVENSCSGVVVA